jgi:hypothetical protein
MFRVQAAQVHFTATALAMGEPMFWDAVRYYVSQRLT